MTAPDKLLVGYQMRIHRLLFVTAIAFTIAHTATATQSWRMVVRTNPSEIRLVQAGDSIAEPIVIVLGNYMDSIYYLDPRKGTVWGASPLTFGCHDVWDGQTLVTVCNRLTWKDFSEDDSISITGIAYQGFPDGEGVGLIQRLGNDSCQFDFTLSTTQYPSLHFAPHGHLLLTQLDGRVAIANIDSCATNGLQWTDVDGHFIGTAPQGSGPLFITRDSNTTIYTSHFEDVYPYFTSDTTFRTIDTGRTQSIAAFTSFNGMDYDAHTGIYYGSSCRDSSHGFYRSTDGGLSFQKTDTITSYSVGVDSTTGVVYIGGENAIYASADSGRTVHLFNNTIPSGIVNTIITNTGGPVLCASSGGVFELLRSEVGMRESRIPSSASIINIMPNPATTSATISFSIPTRSTTQLRIFDILGRCVAEPLHGLKNAGEYSVEIPMSGICAGTYFAELVNGGQRGVKMVVVE